MKLKDKKIVAKQYESGKNLSTRISIHEKYSVNKLGFNNWIFNQYELRDGIRVLELGCGAGVIWKDNIDKLPEDISLILTDFSEGMINEAMSNIDENSNIKYMQVDIQNIPYEDKSFDIVIANMMLYHVPNLNQGLSEVKRVLKDNGIFYCATYGENGIAEYLQEILKEYGVQKNTNKVFTLQNGKDILYRYFDNVEKRIYEDHLEVTNGEDLVDYMVSLSSMIDLNNVSREEALRVVNNKKVDGKIFVPKEYGMFISKKIG